MSGSIPRFKPMRITLQRSTDVRRQGKFLRLGFGLVLGCWAGSVIAFAAMLPTSSQAVGVGPGAFALFFGVLLLLMVLVEIALTLKSPGPAPEVGDGQALVNNGQLLYLGALVATACLVFVVGVLPAIVALVFWSTKVVERRGYLFSLTVTLVLVSVLYLLFSTVLKIRIPLIFT